MFILKVSQSFMNISKVPPIPVVSSNILQHAHSCAFFTSSLSRFGIAEKFFLWKPVFTFGNPFSLSHSDLGWRDDFWLSLNFAPLGNFSPIGPAIAYASPADRQSSDVSCHGNLFSRHFSAPKSSVVFLKVFRAIFPGATNRVVFCVILCPRKALLIIHRTAWMCDSCWESSVGTTLRCHQNFHINIFRVKQHFFLAKGNFRMASPHRKSVTLFHLQIHPQPPDIFQLFPCHGVHLGIDEVILVKMLHDYIQLMLCRSIKSPFSLQYGKSFSRNFFSLEKLFLNLEFFMTCHV